MDDWEVVCEGEEFGISEDYTDIEWCPASHVVEIS